MTPASTGEGAAPAAQCTWASNSVFNSRLASGLRRMPDCFEMEVLSGSVLGDQVTLDPEVPEVYSNAAVSDGVTEGGAGVGRSIEVRALRLSGRSSNATRRTGNSPNSLSK